MNDKNKTIEELSREDEPTAFVPREEYDKVVEENKKLGEMYANTFAKLRDLQKEFSDTKANLHRAYNGLENYKSIKQETAQLREALKELLAVLDNSPEFWSVESQRKVIENARKLIQP